MAQILVAAYRHESQEFWTGENGSQQQKQIKIAEAFGVQALAFSVCSVPSCSNSWHFRFNWFVLRDREPLISHLPCLPLLKTSNQLWQTRACATMA
jgi:hypothetical protein